MTGFRVKKVSPNRDFRIGAQIDHMLERWREERASKESLNHDVSRIARQGSTVYVPLYALGNS